MDRDRVVSTVFQVGDDRYDLVEGMKDIAATRDAGHGQFLARADAGAEIGDGGLGSKAALLQLEQADGPGVGIAVVFAAEQKAVGGSDVGAHQHGLAILEDLIETGDGDVAQIVAEVLGARLVDGITQDVVHRADRHVHAEKITAKFVDAAIGTVADHGPTEGDLPQPTLGDGQVEQHLVIGHGGRGERIVQSGLGGGGLLIDKLATDIELVGQTGDGAVAGKGLQSDRQALARRQRLGGTAVRNSLLQAKEKGSRMAHVCFLRETGGFPTPSLGETDNLEKAQTSLTSADTVTRH